MYFEKECVPDVENSKSFFNSALLFFQPELYSNNKLTAILIVSLIGILVNKLQTS